MIDDVFSNSKVCCHGDRIREYITTKHTKSPVTVELDLTNRCNNKCPKCTGRRINDDDMDISDAKFIIDKLKSFGVRGVTLTGGGEPLLHEYIIEVIEYISNNGLDVGLITSGQSLHMDYNYLDNLIKNLSWIRISLDAGSPEHYKDTHGLDKERFDRVIDFIHKICDIKGKNGYDVDIGVGYLVCLWDINDEINDIDKCVKLIVNDNLSYIQLRPYHDTKYNVEFSSNIIEYLTDEYPNIKLYNTSISRDEDRIYNECHGSRFDTVITVNGNMYYCCLTRNNDKFYLGNILNTNLRDIWNKENLERVSSNVDISKCPRRCKNNVINNTIENILNMYKNTKHRNFL